LETIFWGKILKFFDADPGSGMAKILIRDGKKFGSGINIPDPQHYSELSQMVAGGGDELQPAERGRGGAQRNALRHRGR
jgi:hypothetical protein